MDYDMDIDSTMSSITDKVSESQVETFRSFTANASISDLIIGLAFSAIILVCGVHMSQAYSRTAAEAERHRIAQIAAAEEKKIKDAESNRVKIAKTIESCAIRLTNMTTSSLSLSLSRHKSIDWDNDNTKNRTLPTGSSDKDEEGQSGSFTTKTICLEDNEETDSDIEQPCEGCNYENEMITYNDSIECESETFATVDEHHQVQQASSLPSTNTIISSTLMDAVTNNPCAICLENFRPGDVVICCANSINGKKPHVFHQACSLDYIVSHNDGIKAPCPCCKTSFLPTDSEQKKILKHCQPSVLMIPHLENQEDFDMEDNGVSNTE